MIVINTDHLNHVIGVLDIMIMGNKCIIRRYWPEGESFYGKKINPNAKNIKRYSLSIEDENVTKVCVLENGKDPVIYTVDNPMPLLDYIE